MIHAYPYQRAYLADTAKLKGLLKARRVGGTEMVGMEAAFRALGIDPGTGQWGLATSEYLISASQRQSEYLLKCALRHVLALDAWQSMAKAAVAACRAAGVPAQGAALAAAMGALQAAKLAQVVDPRLALLARQAQADAPVESVVLERRADRITLDAVTAVGEYAEIAAFPANPDTLRGVAGNVRLDEFGVVQHAEEVWAAAYPITGPTPVAPEGYKLSITGTPRGDGSMFARLCRGAEGAAISWHHVDIYRAMADGFPINPEAERIRIGDNDAFLQEYCLVFLGTGERYIDVDLVQEYEPDGPEYKRLEGREPGADYSGMDVARSQFGDLSAIETVRKIGGRYYVRPNAWAARGARFATQAGKVDELIAARVRRVAIDKTGLGAAMAEQLQEKYPSRVEGIQFSNAAKEDLATRAKAMLEDGQVVLPKGSQDLLRDIGLVRRLNLPGGGVRYDVERNRGGKGHGDRFWALALALYAAANAPSAPGGAVWLQRA